MSQIPEWMKTEENYTPSKDREGFIRKSTLKLISILSGIRQGGYIVNRTADAQWKILLSIYSIVLCSCARNMFFVYILLAILMVRICLLPSDSIKRIVLPALFAMIFSVVMLIPAVFMGSPGTMLTVSLKVFFAAGIINTMAVSTPWNQITAGMRFYHIPDVFVFTFDITLKYIVLLGDLAVSMLEALKIRSVGVNRDKKGAMSGILGVTFLKSREMSEEMYEAMVCRGFEGEYRRPEKFHMTRWNAFYLVMIIAMTFIFVYLEYCI